MATCSPPIVPVIGPYGDVTLNQYPDGATRLVTSPNERPKYTANRTTDARSALARGLADYLYTLQFPADGGRVFSFKNVFSVFAEPEEKATYPSAYIFQAEEGLYDASKFVPNALDAIRLPEPDGRYLQVSSEMAIKLNVEIIANDPVERMALVAMCEDGLNPVDWMYGIRLALPHYFGQHATYEPLSMNYDDSDSEDIRRFRRATIQVAANVPVTRLSKYADAQPRIRVEV